MLFFDTQEYAITLNLQSRFFRGLWGIEKGTRNPTIDVVARLAEVLGVEPHQLLMPSP